MLDYVTKLTNQFLALTQKLKSALEHESASAEKHAKHFRDAVIPADRSRCVRRAISSS